MGGGSHGGISEEEEEEEAWAWVASFPTVSTEKHCKAISYDIHHVL